MYLLSKFSTELIAAQVAVLCFTLSLGLYFFLIRKKKQQTAEWVPAALVKAYLDKVDQDEREIRFKLFGEESRASTPVAGVQAAPVQQIVVQGGTDPAILKELEALRGQLGTADQRAMEFDRIINGLKSEKAALEQKLKEALASTSAAPAAAASADVVAVQKQLEEFKAKLAEYEVIEDDLANLKKYQQENKALKEKIESYEKGGAKLSVVSGGADAGAAATTVSAAPAQPEAAATVNNVTQHINTDAATTVSGASAGVKPEIKLVETPPAAAPEAPKAEAPAAAPAPEAPKAETPAAAAPAPAADAPAAAAAPEKSSKQKEDELLSEFEKMLAS